jgi:glycyl-tRNA synthetase
VSFCKRRGFIYPGSELYGSIGTGYDYGPYGAQLKKNVQDAWWRSFVERRPDCVGIDAALLSSPRVWEASGHVEQFVDPLCECASCRKRFRSDKLVKEAVRARVGAGGGALPLPAHLSDPDAVATFSLEELGKATAELGLACPGCGAKGAAGLGTPRQFNLLFSTNVGPVLPSDTAAAAAAAAAASAAASAATLPPSGTPTGSKGAGLGRKGSPSSSPAPPSFAYLRPETAQGAFIHFLNVHNATRKKLPFGIGQVGRSFRNEISVGNFVFRTREFDQMELEYFCSPEESPAHFSRWVAFARDWLVSETVGLAPERVRLREYPAKELAHYALATTDLEYEYPFGWDELWGIANRGDFDLKCHTRASGVQLEYTDPATNKTFTPHVVEPALGVNRLLLAILCDGLVEERVVSSKGGEEEPRTVFRVSEALAPYKAAVLPLHKKDEQVEAARKLQEALLQHFPTDMDVTQAIGKRYRRQDEVGTPWCVTVDPGTAADKKVTVRHRDTMRQARVGTDELLALAAGGKFNKAGMAHLFPPEKQA